MTEQPYVKRVGLIGYPLRHSISPVFQQAAFDALGIPARYELWDTPSDQLSALVARLRGDEYFGANVTIPYKQAVLADLNDVDADARLVGAVNTIVRSGATLRGYNTDVVGFSRSLRVDGQFSVTDSRAVVLGAGGAARAVVAALMIGGVAELTLAARRVEQARALLGSFSIPAAPTTTHVSSLDSSDPRLRSALAAADLLVNATPVGTAHRDDSSAPPIDARLIHRGLLVFDLVYNPPETALLAAARERDARTLNGLPMLVYQGAAAFELWTGMTAPVELMRLKALEALGV